VTATDATGGLFVALSSVADVRADKPAKVLSFLASTNARVVGLPVAAPSPQGWQLAWESLDPASSVIAGVLLAADGTVLEQQPELALGFDERNPTLAPSPGGKIALSWEHFEDRTGNVEVRTLFLGQAIAPSDGGVSEPLPDGGVQLQPIVYSSCGCQAGALPSLLGLALLFLSRRRARARS